MRKVFSHFTWALTGEQESMVVHDSEIEWRGPADQTPAPSDGLGWENLSGMFVLPGFIDAHCHILPTGLDLQKLHLGACSTKSEVLDLVRDRERSMEPDEWLHAVHYDQTRFPDGRHLTLSELDTISRERPILLRHVNGHASIANSAALIAAQVAPEVEDPKGGTYVRDDSGRLNGVLLERAHEFVTAAAPSPTLPQMVDAILAAGEKMSSLGITCASDMMTGRWDLPIELEAYRIASETGCRIRLRLYAQWGSVFGPSGVGVQELSRLTSGMKSDRCRVAGIKIFADGAIGSATAAIYGEYTVSGNGTLIYEPEKLKEMVRIAHDAGQSLAIHSIGDRSTDLVLEAYGRLDDPSGHRIEHAMMMSDAQIDRLSMLGCHCSMQPEFLAHFGHAYVRQLGPNRAAHLKRFRSVMNSGIPLSFSSDRPIVAGDPWDGILASVMRPEGFDPSENISRTEAVRNFTEMGAVANREADDVASLEAGAWADFQVYPTDPLTTERPLVHGTVMAGEWASYG